MKRLAAIFLLAIFVIGLSGCAARTADDLPQSTRLDREVIARASLSIYARAGRDDTDFAADTTFHTRSDGTIVLYLSHQTDLGHPIHFGVLRFRDEVAARSNGTLVVELLYGPNSLGGDVALIDLVNANRLDAAAITIWGAWSGLNDLANLESLPYVFTSYEEAWAAYEGTLGQWVTQNVIEPSGARVLGYWTNGLRHFTNNVRPIVTPADMVGLRMRSPQTSTHLATYEALGAASIAMPFGQVFDALAAGQVDGQDNPFGNIHAARLFEVQSYLSLSYHMFSAAPLIVSNEFWDSLSPQHQQVLLDSAFEAGRFQRYLTVEMEAQQLQEMQAHGMLVNQVNIPLFVEAVVPVWAEHMAHFGSEFAAVASRYINAPDALAHRFSYLP